MQNLSVLVVHNRYQQPGGEDTVVDAEIELLRRRGHRVLQYTRQNRELSRYSLLRKSLLLLTTTWNYSSYSEVRKLIRAHKPDIAHFHNFVPLVSPAAFYACNAAGIPVVQTLHNYRLLCPAGTLFLDGHRCTHCSQGRTPGILRGCYRDSRIQTAAVSLMLGAHGAAGTWKRSVNAYLTPSQFCRSKFVRAGLPAEKIFHRPNFLATDPGRQRRPGEYALFVGRLSSEKGVLEMLEAWRNLPQVPLVVVGDGPLYGRALQFSQAVQGKIKVLGQLNRNSTINLMKGARFLVFPSRWDEPFGMALLEAAACGVPAVAARVGAVPELVSHHQTGLLFDPQEAVEIVEQVRWAWSHPAQMEQMGDAARQAYQQNFTADKSYASLMEVYHKVLGSRPLPL